MNSSIKIDFLSKLRYNTPNVLMICILEKRGLHMFSGIFNYDNPVWRFIGKFFDIMLLNILWIICSIPIVTIGASTTAVYYVTLRLVRDEDSGTIRSFFRSFKENFRQATIIWLILLVVGFVLGFDLYFFTNMEPLTANLRTIMMAVFGGLTLVYLAIFMYIFPIQARFVNGIKRTFFNAFFMSLRHILHTIGLFIIDIATVYICVFLIPQLMVLFFLFGFPLIAYINSFVLTIIFAKYTPKAEEDNGELRPLFQNDSFGFEHIREESEDKT